MIVQLDTHRLQTLGQVREFLDGSQEIDLRPQTRTEAYAFVAETVQRFDYAGRSKADKGLLRRFLTKATDLSRAQVTRLLRQYRTTGEVIDRRGAPRQPFPRRYTPTDIGRLAELDALHGTLSGPTTRKLCARAFHRFGDPRFERLAAISNGHLYNLRHSITYQRRRGTVPAPTRSVQIAIGERRRPQPFGQPGHVRVDTVHQGDLDGVKGLYHLNLVDEVTQFQFIGSVEYIQAACLKPVLEALLRAFPFILHGFHADNGSEFINRDVAALLEAMHIDAFTKSRARRCTDNALVESKNGSVIRKHLGYGHIPNRYAERVHAFNQQFLSPYLNFHRPCFFPSEEVDAKGRVTWSRWFGQLEGLVKVYSDCEITPSSSSAPAPALTGGCHGWHEAGSYPIIDNDDALWNCGNLAAGAQAWAAALAREISNGLWAPASPPSGFSATVSGRPQAGQVHIAGWDMVLGPLMR